MADRVLTRRALNRALLARQLLLERSRLSLTRAFEQVAGLQTQYAPSAYIGLWSRLERFARTDLTRALERKRVVQGTLMRVTIHIVSARDYWPLTLGVRRGRQEWWLRSHRGIDDQEMEAAAKRLRTALAGRTCSRTELIELVGDAAHANGVGLWLDLVRIPPSGTWERRRADLYATAEDWLGPSRATPQQGLDLLVKRYLSGFGPARVGDIADWAGLRVTPVREAVERLNLRTFQDEQGNQLLDVPRGLIPPSETPAPPRFLGVWEAALLVHARQSGVVPEHYRSAVFNTKTPHSVSTFLLDGAVAGSWRVEKAAKKATLVLEPFEPVPVHARRELEEEAGHLVRFVEPDAGSFATRFAGSASRRRARSASRT